MDLNFLTQRITMNPKTLHSRVWILFAVLILVLASINAGSPNVMAGGEEWRPVDAADIALKTPVVEPNADAEAIFWDIRIDDGGAYDLVMESRQADTYAWPETRTPISGTCPTELLPGRAACE